MLISGLEKRSMKEIKNVELIVMIDSNPSPVNPQLKNPWGLSIYIIADGQTLMFDTGPSPEDLIDNANELGVNLESIMSVIFSHGHHDHTGGFSALKPKSVYGPPGTPAKRIIEENLEILPGILALKPLKGPPWETSLLINVEGFGGVLLVGCSHPGVVNLVREAVKILKVRLIIGGFHLSGETFEKCRSIANELKELGVERAGAIHCSGDTMRSVLNEMNILLNAHVGSKIILSYNGIAIYD